MPSRPLFGVYMEENLFVKKLILWFQGLFFESGWVSYQCDPLSITESSKWGGGKVERDSTKQLIQ